MLEKRVLIILSILNVILITALTVFYIKTDRTAPVITVNDTMTYSANTTEAEILSVASAMDKEDGDVTETLVVEKIVPNEEGKTAWITLGAKDESGNVVKQTVCVSYDSAVGAEEGETFQLVVGEAENMLEPAEEELQEVEESEEEITEEAEESEEAEEADEEDAEEEQAEEEAVDVRQDVAVAEAASEENSTRPVLEFSALEVKTALGYNPAWVTVISQLRDDKDTYEQLLGGITIIGDFDNNTPGSYDVNVITSDSDGEQSVPRAIRIIVE